MYAIYTHEINDKIEAYKLKEEISLFGCNVGRIPHYALKNIPNDQSEPCEWQIDVRRTLASEGHTDCSILINLKPNNKAGNVSIYEIRNVFGSSGNGWTTMMFHLRGLIVDGSPAEIDATNFSVEKKAIEAPIFSFLYADGTILEGQLKGRWTAPRASSTNSVLLWPSDIKYFISHANRIIQESSNL